MTCPPSTPLPPLYLRSVRAALEQGGGRLADGGGLGRGVTHVVCDPSSALRWLSMGVGIVSPSWVAQSLRAGRQQRCLAVSADASRHLPAAGAAASAAGGAQQQSQGGGVAGGAEGLSGELLQSREARQAMLSQLTAGGGSGGAPAAGATGALLPAAAHQQAATPAELLTGIHWSVLDLPAAAARAHAAQPAAAAAADE